MATYKEIQIQIQQLEKQADEARRQELATVIATIQSQMQEYGITPEDLRAPRRSKTAKTRQTVEPKYRNPSTGATWSGRGRTPLWLEGKNLTDFLIK